VGGKKKKSGLNRGRTKGGGDQEEHTLEMGKKTKGTAWGTGQKVYPSFQLMGSLKKDKKSGVKKTEKKKKDEPRTEGDERCAEPDSEKETRPLGEGKGQGDKEF